MGWVKHLGRGWGLLPRTERLKPHLEHLLPMQGKLDAQAISFEEGMGGRAG